MRILITGGSGFIGTHLINRLLNDGHEVYNLDKIPSPALPDHRQKIIDILDIDIKNSIFNDKDCGAQGLDSVQPCGCLAALAARR